MRRTFALLCLSFALVLPAPYASASTILVPSGPATIQGAIDAAAKGDEIIVSPGKYKENIRILGKNITLRSTAPTSSAVVAATIIDGRSSASVVTFSGSETSACLLTGFTITKGKAKTGGGGINGKGADATISNNWITSNTTFGSSNFSSGGAIYNCDGLILQNTIDSNASEYGGALAYCDGVVGKNTISRNLSFSYGGAAYKCGARFSTNTIDGNRTYGMGGGFANCSGLVENNIILGNSGKYGGGFYMCAGAIRRNFIQGNSCSDIGGGMQGVSGVVERNFVISNSAGFWGGGIAGASGTVKNNLILYNTVSDEGGGLFSCSGKILNNTIFGNKTYLGSGGGLARCSGEIRNCIIWGNTSPKNAQMSTSSLPVYCDIEGSTSAANGNIAIDPRFADTATGNFHLSSDSPCIDAGSAIPSLVDDLEGTPRPLDGSPQPRGDGSQYDMGAFEFRPPPLLATYWSYYN